MSKRVNAVLMIAFLLAVTATALPLAQAEPPPDSASIWTLQDENAAISTAKLHDRYYTNGLRLGWTSPTDVVPGFISVIGRAVWGDGRQRISVDISQSIFTPANTILTIPDPRDRPYAAVLTGTLSLVQDKESSRSVLGLQLGLMGPGAGGMELQNGFHDVIGDGHAKGWDHQLYNEPVIELLGQRVWRVPLRGFGELETDILPNLEAAVGNLRIYALTGAVYRIGKGINSDFGAARVRPGLTGTDAYMPTRPLAWYVFAGLDGQAVAHDLTLNGNTFRSSPSVPLLPLVAEVEVGLAMIYKGVRISYTHAFQTLEFAGQHNGLHQFASLAFSGRF